MYRRQLRPFDLNRAARFVNGDTSTKFVLTARNAKGNDPAELCVYDEIGRDYGGSGVDPKDVSGFLATNRGKPVTVRINSPGGLVFDGLTIFNSLLAHDGNVTTIVEGIAASIASIIAMAGDRVKAFSASSMMVHRAQGFCLGNNAAMSDCADWLTKIDSQLAQIYSTKTGRPASTMLDLMTGKVDGSILTAQEAKSMGLVDEIIGDGGNGSRNSNPRRPDNAERMVREAHVARMKAKAAQRVRELAGV